MKNFTVSLFIPANSNSTTTLYINSDNTVSTNNMTNAISLSPFLTVTSVTTPVDSTGLFEIHVKSNLSTNDIPGGYYLFYITYT